MIVNGAVIVLVVFDAVVVDVYSARTSIPGHLVTRDAAQVEGGRDPVRLRRYLEAYALNTAGVVEEKTLLEAAGINRRTAQAYERLRARYAGIAPETLRDLTTRDRYTRATRP